MALECLDVSRTRGARELHVLGFATFSETPWLEEGSQMDAEWLSGTRRKRKQRRDAGSSKKWALDSLFNMMPEYVNVKQHLRWPCGGSEQGDERERIGPPQSSEADLYCNE